MTKAVNDALAVLAIDRAKHLGYKGKRRDEFVMDYVAGAISALYLAGKPLDGGHLTNGATMVLAPRGYSEIERWASQCDTTPKQFYERFTADYVAARKEESERILSQTKSVGELLEEDKATRIEPTSGKPRAESDNV